MAVASKVDICNLALDHLGKPSITDLNENSAEAQACLRQYDVARRMCLSRSPWTFARKLRTLSLLSTNALPELWKYHYDLPNDTQKLHRIVEPGRPVNGNRPPVPMYLESGTVYTNAEQAMALYTWDSVDTQTWSSLFDDVVALFLAMRLSPGTTRRKSDTTALQDMYRVALAEAIENDAQQEPQLYTFEEGGYIDARDDGSTGHRTQADGSIIWDQ